MLTKYFFYFLLLCNLVIPITIIARRIISRRGVEFDHVFLFSCGFVFYWILPIALGIINYGAGPDYPMMIIWYDIFHKLTDYKLIIYMSCALAFYISFIIGDLSSNKVAKSSSSKSYTFDKKLLNIPLFLGIIMAIYHGHPLWNKFFTGYLISPKSSEIGPLTAAAVFLLSIAFMFVPDIHEKSGNSLKFLRAIFNKAFIIYLVMIILLVSLGGRCVFISSIFMILVLYSCYFKRLNLLHVVFIFCAVIIVSHMVVMFRTGHPIFNMVTYDISTIFSILFSDNMIISFSLIDFLNNYTFPALQFPTPLLSQIVGIIPTFIFPEKNALYIGYSTLGYKIFTPQGCSNTFVSLVINFGIVGTVIFLFCLSFFLGWLKRKLIQPYQTMYVLTCGWIAISFFRTFESTTIKLIFEFSILAPFLITIILTMISNISRGPKKNG